MAETYKILAQNIPAATTLTNLYTVPTNTSAVVSSLIICNNSATATTFRLSLASSGADDNSKQYIYYNLSIAGNDTFVATIGITLGAGDIIRCYAEAATLSFTALGTEIS